MPIDLCIFVEANEGLQSAMDIQVELIQIKIETVPLRKSNAAAKQVDEVQRIHFSFE